MPAPASGLDGSDLTPLLNDPKAEWDDVAFGVLTTGKKKEEISHLVRTARYRFTEDHTGKPVALYDMQEDPLEMKNLVDDPQHADTVKTMLKLLHP